MKRRHRWIRGDWQIASWILPLVPGAEKQLHKNPISALSKWKIFDNIRRSLVPLALTALLLLGWTVLPSFLILDHCSFSNYCSSHYYYFSLGYCSRKPKDVNTSDIILKIQSVSLQTFLFKTIIHIDLPSL